MNPKRSIIATASARIGAILLVPGILSLIFSIIGETSILAFIGLGLTFWGALFIIITPKRYVEGTLLDSAALPLYQTTDRIIKNFQQKPIAYHTPPYPKDVYLPDHLKGLKDMVVFITTENEKAIPSIQELAEGKFTMRKPHGVVVSPPGLGLLTTIENKTNADFTKMNLEELCETLPHLILDNFGLAHEMEMTPEQNNVKLILFDSIYKNLYSNENNLKSIFILGCPIVSAAACAIAKTTGKPVTIQKQETSPDGSTLKALISIVQE